MQDHVLRFGLCSGSGLGQRIEKKSMAICYASKTLAEAEMNYMTTEKEIF